MILHKLNGYSDSNHYLESITCLPASISCPSNKTTRNVTHNSQGHIKSFDDYSVSVGSKGRVLSTSLNGKTVDSFTYNENGTVSITTSNNWKGECDAYGNPKYWSMDSIKKRIENSVDNTGFVTNRIRNIKWANRTRETLTDSYSYSYDEEGRLTQIVCKSSKGSKSTYSIGSYDFYFSSVSFETNCVNLRLLNFFDSLYG